jgi:hypothetical protein
MSLTNPSADLVPVYVTGKGPSHDIDKRGLKMDKVPRGFLLSVDGILDVVLASGQRRIYPSGTFATNLVHPLQIQQVMGGTTACIYVSADSNITFA